MKPRQTQYHLRVTKALLLMEGRAAPADDRGIALVITLLLLALMSVIGLAMVVSTSSDMLINGYYRNFRGSFYAADSGLSVARAQLGTQLVAAFPTTPVTYFASPPLASPSTTATTVLSYVTTNYGSSFTSLNGGQASNSWSESFEISNTSKCTNSVSLAAGYPQVTSTNAEGQNTGYRYLFNYTLCSAGRALASQQVDTSENGSITVNITAQTSTTQSTKVSFAAFGGFVNNYAPCLGPLVPGTMTGPMFTNGAWQFMTGGAYIFTDPVGQSTPDADYWFGGTCIQSPTSSYTRGNQTISPNFQQGLELNQAVVALPPNDYSQEWAALDGKGVGESNPSPTDANLNAALKNVSGTSYPNTGASSGVYLPYASISGVNTMTGGGIYVEGNASVQLSIGTDTAGNPTEIYTITQGGTTTTVTTDPDANPTANTPGITTIKSGSTTLTLAGVPENLDVSPPQPATMLFVDGTISSLSGPGQGQPAIQDGNQITIVAKNNVDITGDVIYKTEPVTTTQNQIVAGSNPPCCAGTPVDTLIPGNDNNQVFGIFTANGNINLQSSYSNNNLQVDGSLAAISQNCASNSCGFTATGYINTFNNVGGQIQSNIFSADMSTENTYFDRRFTSRANFYPPWFPSTTIAEVDIVNALTPSITEPPPQRISWITTPQ